MITVFIGPTLSARDAASILDAEFLPPASQGDVYLATRRRPWAIGIVDGYFERLPAVWHKEILWAMAEGIHVLGAASMGALRAVELESFGMVGVGKIFKAYREGRIEDDDEVAVVHGSAEEGFRAGSEALVNIRATLERAFKQGVIDSHQSQEILQIAKSLYYPSRNFPAILERAEQDGIPSERIDRLRTWLSQGRVDQKRKDAIALLRTLGRRFSSRPEPKRVSYTFQRTEMWERAVLQAERYDSGTGAKAGPG